MKGSKKVIDALNDVLGGELVGINQYFLHAKMCKNWGFERLAEDDYKESIGEMKHAERAHRAHPLPGRRPEPPEARQAPHRRDGPRAAEDRPRRSRSTPSTKLNKAIALCVAEGDNTSRDLLEDILESEEEHVDWLETQLGLIKTARRDAVPGRADAQVTARLREPALPEPARRRQPTFRKYSFEPFGSGFMVSLPGRPVGRAHLAVLVGELHGLDDAQRLVHRPPDRQIVDGDVPDHALRVDHEESAERDAVRQQHAVVACDLLLHVGQQRDGDARRCRPPCGGC